MKHTDGSAGRLPHSDMRQAPLVAWTVFLGSFLLFAVQPMMGRMLLPAFGGSSAVWTVCLAAYQILLLAGYAYAHGLSRGAFARQRRIHGMLLALAVVWICGLLAARGWLMFRVGASSVPSLEVLACVVLGVGLPYVLLASGSSLLQAWLARTGVGRGVYGLYAISNLGSLLGLLSYPLVVEPFVSLSWQWIGWAAGLTGYALLVGLAGKGREAGRGADATASTNPPPSSTGDLPVCLTRSWVWFALPACSSFLLVAATNHLSLDVEPVPLMWVFLLGAFLFSYTIGFSGWAHKVMPVWLCLAAMALGIQTWHGIRAARSGSFLVEMLLGCAVLFLIGLFLHSWLYRIRPHTGRLTAYYLGLAAGGAAGGAAASLLSPVLFRQALEFPVALVFSAVLIAWFTWRLNHRELKGLNETILLICVAAPLLLGWSLAGQGRGVIQRYRNFYGALRVVEATQTVRFDATCNLHSLMNGETLHGMQCLYPGLSRLGTTYYGPLGGGFAVQQHPAYTNRALRVGCIGLGAGTMAVYGRTNDVYRFFEINPQVVKVAGNTNLFTYLADCRAQVQLAVGDARKTLALEEVRGDPRYDVLIVDAYSGDAIPIHLATSEAFRLYLRRLAPGGILAVHVSNWHIDLLPLCKAMGRELDLHLLGLISDAQPARLSTIAHWVMMCRAPFPLTGSAIPQVRQVDWAQVRDIRAPTDETGSLLGLVRFGARPPLEDARMRPEDVFR